MNQRITWMQRVFSARRWKRTKYHKSRKTICRRNKKVCRRPWKGKLQGHPGREGVHGINMKHHSLHFSRTGLYFAIVSAYIYYFCVSAFCSKFSANTNVTSNIPKLSHQGPVFKNGSFTQRKRFFLRTEWKPIVHVHDNLHKYSKPGALVFDPCLVIGATEKACLSENKHPKFIGFDNHRRCVREMSLS